MNSEYQLPNRVISRSIGLRVDRFGYQFTFLLIAAGLTAICPHNGFAAEPEFIADFIDRDDDWPKLVNVTVRLEGRYASISSKALRLQGSDLAFRSAKQLVKPDDTATIEVVGHLVRENNRYTFVVDRISPLPHELIRYERMVSKIDFKKGEDWHAVGEWLKRRGEFYDDSDLKKKAMEAFQKEFAVDLRSVKIDDLGGRLKLADKVTKLGLPESLREEVVHEAYYKQWELISKQILAARKANQPPQAKIILAIQDLAEQIARDLPGSNEPLNPPQPDLLKQYFDDPTAAYLKADGEQRRLLHRFLYAEMRKTMIVREAEIDRTKGYQAAGRIEKELPDYIHLAEELRKMQLTWEQTQLGTYSRRQVLDLVQKFRDRQQEEDAKSTLTSWLDIRQSRLRDDDAAEHIRLSEDYFNLLHDEKQTADLLIKAYRLTPTEEDISKRLVQLGLVLKEGNWIWTRDLADPVLAARERAIREGRVETGMSRQQVRRSLGSPTVISRVRSSRQVDEVWMYRLGTETLLAVQFSIDGRNKEPTAVSISEVANADFADSRPQPTPVTATPNNAPESKDEKGEDVDGESKEE
ncbi:MAG: hypothetical protein ACKVT0_16865 [Planctomycetaceae bacterium]